MTMDDVVGRVLDVSVGGVSKDGPPGRAFAMEAGAAPTRPSDSDILRLGEQYEAIGRAIMAVQVDSHDDEATAVELPQQESLKFEFLRADATGSVTTEYEAPSSALRCPGLSGDDELVRRAIATRSVVVDDARAGGEVAKDGTRSRFPQCAACGRAPHHFSIVAPVLWKEDLLGACRIVRCGPMPPSVAVDISYTVRLAESVAFAEKYRQRRLLERLYLDTVLCHEHSLMRLSRRLRLANVVSCDILYAIDLSSGELSMERTGLGLQIGDPPDGTEPATWFRSLIHPDDARLWEEMNGGGTVDPGTIRTVEYRVRGRDGGTMHARDSQIVDRGVDGDPSLRVGVLRDITSEVRERERLNAERAGLAQLVDERTAELSDANVDLVRAARLKDEFLASMSHELRTPLNSILGLTEAAREGIWGPLNAQQEDKLRLVEESGRHLLSLINDILDLAKIGAGKLEPDIASVDVVGTAEATLRLVSQLALEKRVQLSFRPPEERPVVETDGRMLMQILLNLLNNAVKFTPSGGRVLLEVESSPDVVMFRVTDTGIGIAAAEMGRIFRPFVQVSQGLARPYGGTGLGLALVARLASLLHGDVDVRSELGVGSVFTLRLPIHPDAACALGDESLASARPRGEPPTSCTILLAEDDDATARTFTSYLAAKGYDVRLARDGREALRMASDVRPALILMDIQMPEMDGLEAIRQLRADPSFGATPIIGVSALAFPSDRERCLAAGASEYITKPTSLRKLSERIADFIGVPRNGVVS